MRYVDRFYWLMVTSNVDFLLSLERDGSLFSKVIGKGRNGPLLCVNGYTRHWISSLISRMTEVYWEKLLEKGNLCHSYVSKRGRKKVVVCWVAETYIHVRRKEERKEKRKRWKQKIATSDISFPPLFIEWRKFIKESY